MILSCFLGGKFDKSIDNLDEYFLEQVLYEGKSCVRKVTLNRPRKLNSLTFEMISQIYTAMRAYENDAKVNLVIVKGKGKAFCAGGDVMRVVLVIQAGHWTFAASFYRRQLMLDYLLATYKKPLVFFINGIVMGGGAGLSMNGMFRIVTENTVFSMPEVAIGHFPDVGASYFLSRLPGYYGEYLGLTGARINGFEMLACGLGTHLVLSKDLHQLEKALCELVSSDAFTISKLIDKFIYHGHTIQDSFHERLELINKCFCRETVEEILFALEEMASGAAKWILEAISSLKSASPTSLKIGLRSIREGRKQTLELCLAREYITSVHVMRGDGGPDFFEGARAVLFEKDKKPNDAFQTLRGSYCHFGVHRVWSFKATRSYRSIRALMSIQRTPIIVNVRNPTVKMLMDLHYYREQLRWKPSQLCQVSEEMVDRHFAELETEIEDEDFKCLQLPARSSPNIEAKARL